MEVGWGSWAGNGEAIVWVVYSFQRLMEISFLRDTHTEFVNFLTITLDVE